jgi:hypothetical protein
MTNTLFYVFYDKHIDITYMSCIGTSTAPVIWVAHL